MSMKRNSFLICILAVLLLFSCGGRGKTASALPDGDTIPLRYAENLTLVSYPDYTLATLRNPWDTLHTLHTYILVPKDRELPAHLPEGTVVRTPLSKSVIYSSVHCGLMDNLGVFSSIGGVCDLKYIKLLAVPHVARMILGTTNHNSLLPVTILSGGAVALLCNLICVLPGEAGIIPLNAVTPIIGAPVIIYVILSQRKPQQFN